MKEAYSIMTVLLLPHQPGDRIRHPLLGEGRGRGCEKRCVAIAFDEGGSFAQTRRRGAGARRRLGIKSHGVQFAKFFKIQASFQYYPCKSRYEMAYLQG